MRRAYRRIPYRPMYRRPVFRRRPFVWRPFIPWIGLMGLIGFFTLVGLMLRW